MISYSNVVINFELHLDKLFNVSKTFYNLAESGNYCERTFCKLLLKGFHIQTCASMVYMMVPDADILAAVYQTRPS